MWLTNEVRHGSAYRLTAILTASHCGASRRGPGTRPRAVVCWRWPRSTMVAAGRMRRGSAASVCNHSRLGAALQRPRTGRAGMGSHRARLEAQRRSPAAHWRRLLRPARSRRSTASCAGGAKARWLLETFAISETTVGRELKALGFAKISARPRHYAQNELAVEALKKTSPHELAKIRARLPKGRDRAVVAR